MGIKVQLMNIESIRYYISVTLLVLGCSGLPAGIIVFGIKKIIHIDENHLDAVYLVTYIILVIVGLKLYIPRMRGVI
jgi:hypothetical protein